MCMPGREDAGMEVGSESTEGRGQGCCPQLLLVFSSSSSSCLPRAVLALGCALRLSLGVCPIQSPNAGGTLSGTFTRSRGAMPSAGPRARCPGWSAGAHVRARAAARACG